MLWLESRKILATIFIDLIFPAIIRRAQFKITDNKSIPHNTQAIVGTIYKYRMSTVYITNKLFMDPRTPMETKSSKSEISHGCQYH